MNGCARCAGLRAALDADDTERLVELLEDLYRNQTGSEWVPSGSGAGPASVERLPARPRTSSEGEAA